ncbi:CD209 antigen-like protein 2 [Corythoichthys intestinalis]|uniref:CD209 antigen-like protein 2 n=1 Tax=Corythoichthys intestinalis TaxID=161448 RepID=UPI0025A68C58|nr:CD209 antigen-like protein 2 [Corythoichthys intestinalis]XP_057683611.1 CD209 antigen-like protein 2 [Corythoichthys intestinalis]
MPGPDVVDLEVFVESGNGERAAASTSYENDYALVSGARSHSKPPSGAKLARSKFTTERKALVVFGVLLISALVALRWLAYQIVQLKRNHQQLLSDYEELKNSLPTTQVFQESTCWRCDFQWELKGESCYYFSESNTTWKRSREFCERRTSDLVKIDSRDEQIFLQLRLKDIMSSPEDKFWIGLTDSRQEGQWLWVDESCLDPSFKFWARNQPDDYQPEKGGEDCVGIGQKGSSTNFNNWFDKACEVPHRLICEKAAQRRSEPWVL